ncbi:MAG: hypothetical protein GX251_10390 [Firmicutes bacterium]|nr:hypothetical protein [Bacillota bacterium]
MLIKIRHPKFNSVELRDGSLVIHSMQGRARMLQENVEDVAVDVTDGVIRVVAFLDKTYAWCFSGRDDLRSERIEFDLPYGGGGKLTADGRGNIHLLYLAKQAVGSGSLLRHQVYTDQWSIPQTVSTNVFADKSSFSASWHGDGYLHLVYCGYQDQPLYYRVYDLERRVWSGAVVFSEARCSRPQFIPTPETLYLFWQEERDNTVLKVRSKKENWSPVAQVSTGDGHAAAVGFSRQNNEWKVLWGEESRFYASLFDHWSDRQVHRREDYDYIWMAEGSQTLALYQVKAEEVLSEQTKEESAELKEPVPEASPPPVPKKDPVLARQESEEAKLQAAFMEQAFRTLQEWEQARAELARLQREFKMPEPVDLTPLVTRIERLERRLLNLQQSQEQSKKLCQDNLAQMEQGISRLRMRLQAVEDTEKNRPQGFWQRVLGRQ